MREHVLNEQVGIMLGWPLDDTTPLITGGLIDSIGMVDLIRFIERRFGFQFGPKEVDAHRLDTIEAITLLIQRKLDKGTVVASTI